MNAETIETVNLQFEVTTVDSKTAQILRNVENFHDSSMILIGAEGELIYYNSRAVKLFELDKNFGTADLKISDLLHYLAQRGDFGPGDPAKFTEIAAKVINPDQDGVGQIAQSYLTMPSGNILRILIYRNSDGTVTLSAHDVSDQRRNENMLKMALDIGFAGYLIFDVDKICCRVESRYLTNLFTPDEMHTLETMGPSTLFHPDDLALSQGMWDMARKIGEAQRATLRMITQKEGVRWFRFVLMPESGAPNCNRIVAFFNDVTDRLRQEENLREAKLLAEESLSSKERFLAHMSHEIRTPMNAVIGMTDALIHHHDDPTIAPQLELIQKSATSTLKMLDETLTYSRLNADSFALDPSPASPAEVVRDVCALWEQQALKNGCIIRCIIKDDVPDTIFFDKFRYEQCINNLLSNAVKFTDGGKIDIILTVAKKQASTPYLILAVRDTGIGMTPEQQSHIFEAYAQADKTISSRFGGTGLGMNITKQIVERMGGTISIRSKIGVGSMFAMSVPMTETEQAKGKLEIPVILPLPNTPETVSQPIVEAQTGGKPRYESEHSLLIIEEENQKNTSVSLIDDMLIQAQPEATIYSSLKILVVDDNPTNHLVIKSLLGTVVAEVVLASDGAEALNVLDTTPIDIVLMDIHMPIMDGIECTLAIRSSEKVWKDVIIIALTADPEYQQIKLCKNIGMDEALAKPVRLNDLLEAMETVLLTNNTEAKTVAA